MSMTNVFSFEQQAILDGSLLGDGSLSKPRGKSSKSYFTKAQCFKRREYLDWHLQELQPFSSSIKIYDNYASGKKYKRAIFATHASEELGKLRERWYPNGKKIVPCNLKLTPLNVAIWFCDDGSNFVPKRQCRLATYCFSRNDCEHLIEQLHSFDIECYLSKQNVIGIKAGSYETFLDLVTPHIPWRCFSYKLQSRPSKRKFISDEAALKMIKMAKEDLALKDIAVIFKCSITTVSDIVRGKRKQYLGQPQRDISFKNTSGHKNISFDKSRDKWCVAVKRNLKTCHAGLIRSQKLLPPETYS